MEMDFKGQSQTLVCLLAFLWLTVSNCDAECGVIRVQNALQNVAINGFYALMDLTCDHLPVWKHILHHRPGVTLPPGDTLQPSVYYFAYSNTGGVHGWAITTSFCSATAFELATVRSVTRYPYTIPAGMWSECTPPSSTFHSTNDTDGIITTPCSPSVLSAICVQEDLYEDYLLEFEEHRPMSGGEIAGIVIGILLLIIVLVSLSLYLRSSRPAVFTQHRVIYHPPPAPPAAVTVRFV